jgi:hypothetical protein
MRIVMQLILLLFAVTTCWTSTFNRPFIFGTQVLDEGRLEEMLIELAKYGGTQSRVGTCWWNNEPEPGKGYDFREPDELVNLHLKHGYSVLLNVATVPLWASEAPPEAVKILKDRKHDNLIGTFMVSPNHMDEYVRWVEAVGRHFGDRIDYYEIWNEPDGMAGPIIHYNEQGDVQDVWYGGDPAQFTRVLKAAYTALHKVDPGCTVVAGSLESKTWFLRGIYEAGGKDYFDAVSIHPYGEPLRREWIQEIRDLMLEYGDGHKGIWVTEYGWGFGDKPGFVREAIRWARENEYLTALHIHLANHLFRNNKVGEGPLKPTPGLLAFRDAVKETGPALTKSYDFEGVCPSEWRFRADKAEGSKFGCVSDVVHNGRRAIRASSEGTSVSLIANVYVKDHNSTLRFWTNVPVGENVRLSVTTTPGTPIYGADRTKVLYDGNYPVGKWVEHQIRLSEIDPYLAGKTLMNLTITAESQSPGVTLVVDDFAITPGKGPVKELGERPSSLVITVKDYLDRPVRLRDSDKIKLLDPKGKSKSLCSEEEGIFRANGLSYGWYRLLIEASGYEPLDQPIVVKPNAEVQYSAYLNPNFNMVKNASFEAKGFGGPNGDQVGVGFGWETVCGGAHPEIYDVTALSWHSGRRSQMMTSEGYNIDFVQDPPVCFELDKKSGEKIYHKVPGIKLGNQAIAQIIEQPVIPGEEYQFSAWVKIQRLMAHWEWFRLSIYWLDKDGNFIGESRESEENKKNIDRHDWKLITCRGVAPAGAVKAKVYLHHHFEHGVVWYDDVCFARVKDIQ